MWNEMQLYVTVTIGTLLAMWVFSVPQRIWKGCKRAYARLQTYLIRKLMDYMLSSAVSSFLQPSSTESDSSSRKVDKHSRYMTIPYVYMGKDYIVRIPFSRKHRRKMIDYKVFLQMENGEEVDITQQPGCMYLLNASMMGGIGIRVHHIPDRRDTILDASAIPLETF
jgi:hypothetical protein